MDKKLELQDSLLILDVAVELGFLDRERSDTALTRQKQLRKGNLNLSMAQILLERQLLTQEQLKTIHDEVEARRSRHQKHQPLKTKQTIFGKFQIDRVLADNGYTRVIKAFDLQMASLVVLKILPGALSKQTQWFERFKREMFLVSNLSHPNIIGVHECGSVNDEPFISFEYLEGLSLSLRLEREGNFPEETCWLVAREIAKGLAHIEEKGILHRDLKPDNILCGLDGSIKIIDLGLARSLLDNAAITAMGQTVGTPFYMSPEQACGTKGLDHRTDLYSLGCIIYHMLAGAVPFFADDAVEVMLKHNEAERPDPREFVPELHAESKRLVQWLMAVKPEDRPESAAVLVEEITNLLLRLPDPSPSARSIIVVQPS